MQERRCEAVSMVMTRNDTGVSERFIKKDNQRGRDTLHSSSLPCILAFKCQGSEFGKRKMLKLNLSRYGKYVEGNGRQVCSKQVAYSDQSKNHRVRRLRIGGTNTRPVHLPRICKPTGCRTSDLLLGDDVRVVRVTVHDIVVRENHSCSYNHH